jgi:hypothetical protein
MLKKRLEMLGCTDPSQLSGRIEEVLRQSGGKARVSDAPQEVPAYVSEGRWVADCPECNGGIAVDPEDIEATCLDCGLATPISSPALDDQTKADLVLSERPIQARNWFPHRGETVNDLKAENLLRGIPIPPEAI